MLVYFGHISAKFCSNSTIRQPRRWAFQKCQRFLRLRKNWPSHAKKTLVVFFVHPFSMKAMISMIKMQNYMAEWQYSVVLNMQLCCAQTRQLILGRNTLTSAAGIFWYIITHCDMFSTFSQFLMHCNILWQIVTQYSSIISLIRSVNILFTAMGRACRLDCTRWWWW